MYFDTVIPLLESMVLAEIAVLCEGDTDAEDLVIKAIDQVVPILGARTLFIFASALMELEEPPVEVVG